MKIDIDDSKEINIFVDENKNIVIFPISALGRQVPDSQGKLYEPYWPAYFPIEVKYPYTQEELAEKIDFAFSQWCKHPCYERMDGKNTFEEKYYGIKGFKNAIRGKRFLYASWHRLLGVYVSMMLPYKSGYGYHGLEKVKLNETSDEYDFAKAVIHLANVDLESLKSFKVYKRQLLF